MKEKLIYSVALVGALALGILTFNAFKYDIQTLDGQKISLSSVKQKTIVVNYFAEWCAPCLREVPELNLFHSQNSKDVLLLGISYDNLSQEKLREINDKYGFLFPLVVDGQESLRIQKPDYLPATYLLDGNGKIKGPLLGEQTSEGLLEAIEAFHRIN